MKNKRPICGNCNKECEPAGGIVGENSKTIYWACWNCDYKVEDIEQRE